MTIKKVISCPKCSKKVRVPIGKHIRFVCPACAEEFDYDDRPVNEKQSNPEVGNIKEDRPKHFKRIVESVYYGWALVLLTAVCGILEYTENEEGRIYSWIVFLSLTSLVRIYWGLKSYLSSLLNYDKANININWLIGTSIPMYLFMALESRIDFETRFSEDTALIIFLVFTIAGLLFVFHSLRLAVKLFKVEDSAIGAIRTYAFLQILTFGFLLGVIFFVDLDNYPVILGTLLELIPLVFLVIGLKKVRDKYVPQHAL